MRDRLPGLKFFSGSMPCTGSAAANMRREFHTSTPNALAHLNLEDHLDAKSLLKNARDDLPAPRTPDSPGSSSNAPPMNPQK